MNGRGILALVFLINVLFGLYTAAILLRFLLQRARADFYNPLVQAVVRITNPLLAPLRRLFPGWRGLDFAALLLALGLQLANVLLVLAAAGLSAGPLQVLLWAVLKLVFVLVNLYFFTILAEAILSWTGSGWRHPLAAVLERLNAPLLAPARRLIPPLGGLDFSPLVAMILLQVVNILLPLQWPLV